MGPSPSTFQGKTLPLTIRKATAADVSTIVRLVKALADYEKLENEAVVTAMQVALALFGPEPQAYVLLAEQHPAETAEKTVVGMAFYCYRFSAFLGNAHLFLDNLYVDPAVRGAGIGKALFKALAKTAAASHCSEIHWRVLHWNEPTIAFYNKLGATEQDGWAYYSLKGNALQALLEETTQ
jgi:GNAT superfamily N-acetyltransferase